MAKNKLMSEAKDTMKLGVTSMVGMGAMGAIGSIPGMPKESSVITKTVGGSLGLLNVGQLGKSGLVISKILSKK